MIHDLASKGSDATCSAAAKTCLRQGCYNTSGLYVSSLRPSRFYFLADRFFAPTAVQRVCLYLFLFSLPRKQRLSFSPATR